MNMFVHIHANRCKYIYKYLYTYLYANIFKYRPYYNLHKFESKRPVLVNGNLRLNFKGRVGTFMLIYIYL
jgi:hypothetical protein